MSRDPWSPGRVLDFLEARGVALESGRGAGISLAEAVAGEPIHGSWWGHPQGRAIFRATRVARASPHFLVCRLIDGKVTYVHERLWPALVRLAEEIGPQKLDAIREEHTASGAHRVATTAFPDWVPTEVLKAAEKLTEAAARGILREWMALARVSARKPGRSVER